MLILQSPLAQRLTMWAVFWFEQFLIPVNNPGLVALFATLADVNVPFPYVDDRVLDIIVDQRK